jgi:hypothetical protein
MQTQAIPQGSAEAPPAMTFRMPGPACFPEEARRIARSSLGPRPEAVFYEIIIIILYLHFHCTWDRLCHSCIGSSFLPHGAFPEGGAYAVLRELHAGSLEAH